jgi:hypothetical protein
VIEAQKMPEPEPYQSNFADPQQCPTTTLPTCCVLDEPVPATEPVVKHKPIFRVSTLEPDRSNNKSKNKKPQQISRDFYVEADFTLDIRGPLKPAHSKRM